ADVLPRRPALDVRPDAPEHPRRAGAGVPDRRLRLGHDDPRFRHRLPSRRRPSRPERHTPGGAAMAFVPTASQTAGPFVHIDLTWLCRDCLAPPGSDGKRSTVGGRILDGDGHPVTDAVIEIWQADPRGRYADAALHGFGRVATDGNGVFRFTTVKP